MIVSEEQSFFRVYVFGRRGAEERGKSPPPQLGRHQIFSSFGILMIFAPGHVSIARPYPCSLPGVCSTGRGRDARTAAGRCEQRGNPRLNEPPLPMRESEMQTKPHRANKCATNSNGWKLQLCSTKPKIGSARSIFTVAVTWHLG